MDEPMDLDGLPDVGTTPGHVEHRLRETLAGAAERTPCTDPRCGVCHPGSDCGPSCL